MSFYDFQSNCRHAKYGKVEDDNTILELTCRKPECIPKGHSWGVCDENHCPFFGMKIENGRILDATTGKVIGSFDSGRLVFGN